ncbi:MAG TPA: PocR ligand-binding domain-containing protein [Desulfobacterales bacterium]|nr:PocR ligand-binding domain-containing protein [Desulfobacterales bacterium]
MELTEILPVEGWMQFEKELFDRFNINATVYSTSGISVTGKPIWCNPLCPVIKANQESLELICKVGNQNFMAQAKKSKEFIIGECDAGLIKIAVPILVNGEFLGTAGGCGRLPAGGEAETFIIEKTTGLNEEAIAELCRGLEPISEGEARQAAEFIKARLAQHVAQAGIEAGSCNEEKI